MKANITKKIMLDLTLDSSETIMFTKGGKHKIEINPECLIFDNTEDASDYDADEGEFIKKKCIIEISVQMDRSDKDRYDFITGEAKKHREIYDKEKSNETK